LLPNAHWLVVSASTSTQLTMTLLFDCSNLVTLVVMGHSPWAGVDVQALVKFTGLA
jgi:hypothetical protein